MSDKTQRLVLSILDFLTTSIADGTVKQDDKEGIEVAVQCIGEAFGVDPTDETQRERLSVKPATLQNIFDVYLKTKDRVGATAKAGPSEKDKSAAEQLKQAGNAAMSRKEYVSAIESYDKAIELDGTNPVYYSNRAAAHSSKGDHHAAVIDAQKALECDPKFVKAYSRLGHAHYSLGEFASAKDAFSKGLSLEPGNTNLKAGHEAAEKELNTAATPAASTSGSNDDIAEAMRSFGGPGAGAGGMPDMASLMNNPAIMSMAQQMMGNGGLERLMQNPALSNMMERVQAGGGMPSMAEIMADPQLRDMATSMMGAGLGGAGGAAGGGAGGGAPRQ